MHAQARRGRQGLATSPPPTNRTRTTVGPDVSDYPVANRVADLSLTVATLTPRAEEEIKRLLDEVLVRGQFDENAIQLVAYVCALEKEKDTRFLTLVLDMMMQWLKEDSEADVYHCARLCQVIGSQILPTIHDGKTVGSDGQPVVGARLFRTYLLDRCHNAMEHIWRAKEVAISLVDRSPEHAQASYLEVTKWINFIEFIYTLWGSFVLGESVVHDIIDRQFTSARSTDREIYKVLARIGLGTRFSREHKMESRMNAHYIRLQELAQNRTIAPEVQESILSSIPKVEAVSKDEETVSQPSVGIAKISDASHPLAPTKNNPLQAGKGPANIIAQAPKTGVVQAVEGSNIPPFGPNSLHDGRFQVTASTPLTWVVAFFTQFTDAPVHDFTAELKSTSFSLNESVPVQSSQLSDIYRATLSTGVRIAIKCVRTAISGNSNVVKHTVAELDAWSKLRHKNILELLGIALFNGRLAMVSQWMEKGSIIPVVNSRPELDRYALCLQVAEVVAWLHEQKLVHGDLKGANILMSDNDTPKLTDFGLSITQQGVFNYSTTFQGGGTAKWMAPELMGEYPARSYQTDVYALGMTILEILTGREPFEEITNTLEVVHAVRSEKRVPRRPHCLSENTNCNKLFWTAMRQCWTYDSGKRPPAADILEILRNAIGREDSGSKSDQKRSSYCCTFA